MRPNLFGIGFVGIDVDHPVEDLRVPAAAGLHAGVFGGDRAAEAELLQTGRLQLRALGREANLDVLVPARDAERDARVQIVVGCALRRGEHGAFEFIAVARFFVEQRRGMLGVEGEAGFERVPVVREMVVRLRHFGMEDFEAVGERHFVVLVFFDGAAQRRDECGGALIVRGIRRAQRGHEHVRVHVHVMAGHGVVRGRGRVGIFRGVVAHVAHVHAGRGVGILLLFPHVIFLFLRARGGLRCQQKNCAGEKYGGASSDLHGCLSIKVNAAPPEKFHACHRRAPNINAARQFRCKKKRRLEGTSLPVGYSGNANVAARRAACPISQHAGRHSIGTPRARESCEAEKEP